MNNPELFEGSMSKDRLITMLLSELISCHLALKSLREEEKPSNRTKIRATHAITDSARTIARAKGYLEKGA